MYHEDEFSVFAESIKFFLTYPSLPPGLVLRSPDAGRRSRVEYRYIGQPSRTRWSACRRSNLYMPERVVGSYKSDNNSRITRHYPLS